VLRPFFNARERFVQFAQRVQIARDELRSDVRRAWRIATASGSGKCSIDAALPAAPGLQPTAPP
jgi:hypothetical protein